MVDPARLERTLTRGRAAAQARMTSAATVRRRTGETTQNETTGRQTPQWTVVHTSLPCRVVPRGASRRLAIGGVETQIATPRLDFLWDTTDLRDGDLIDLTAGQWAGSVYKIVESAEGDQRTARRLAAEQTDRPAEWSA